MIKENVRRKQTVFTLYVFKRKPNEQRTDGITATGLQEECERGFHFITAFTQVSDIVVKSKAVKLTLGHF